MGRRRANHTYVQLPVRHRSVCSDILAARRQDLYRGSLSTLAFSFEVYNALILGLPEVSSSAIGTLVATEAFLGPFFIALFVFLITQPLAR